MKPTLTIMTLLTLILTACGVQQAMAPLPTPSPTPPPVPTAVYVTALPTIVLPTEAPDEPTTDSPLVDNPSQCAEVSGQVIQTIFDSQTTGEPVHYQIYLPPCYHDTARRYPTLIMLHGLGENMDDGQWARIGLPQAADIGFTNGTLPPMVIVMPNGLDARHDYDPGPYPQVIMDDLLPHLASQFCIWDEPAMRAIGGLSRGGYWAYGIAFTYPDQFNRVGGHSAFFYDGDYPPFNPYNLISTAPNIEQLPMYLDHGIDDTIVDANMQSFVQLLRRRGIEPEVVVNSVGQHTEEYWSSHTTEYLAFYAEEWSRDVNSYPSCHEPSP